MAYTELETKLIVAMFLFIIFLLVLALWDLQSSYTSIVKYNRELISNCLCPMY